MNFFIISFFLKEESYGSLRLRFKLFFIWIKFVLEFSFV